MEVTEEGEQKEKGPSHTTVVSVPSQKEIEEMLIRRKKKVIHLSIIEILHDTFVHVHSTFIRQPASNSVLQEIYKINN